PPQARPRGPTARGRRAATLGDTPVGPDPAASGAAVPHENRPPAQYPPALLRRKLLSGTRTNHGGDPWRNRGAKDMHGNVQRNAAAAEMGTAYDVIVIGAGWSGLMACNYGRAEGLRTVALEGRERIGGRWTF